jgi:hypothetical protein
MSQILAGRGRYALLGAVVLLSVVSVAGGAAAQDDAATSADVDYTVGSVAEFDYYNSRGFADTNGDGEVVIAVEGTLNMSESRDPTLRYDGDAPLVVRGGGFTNVTAPFVVAEPDAPVTLSSLSI